MKLNEARELTFEERATHGTCPTCGAVDGEPCQDISGKEGVHLGRLQKAPFKVMIVEAK